METENSSVSRAEELKALANEAFRAKKYSQAIDLYSQAIELNSQNAVYYANRAFAHTKLEEYGSAIQDASKAIEIDPRYPKACFTYQIFVTPVHVKKLSPNDPDAAQKVKECEKAVKKLKFEEAIAVPESERHSVADSIDYRSIGMSPSSSFVSTQAAILAATATVVVAVVVMVWPAVATTVAGMVVAVLMILGAYWWGSCSGSGVFTKSRKLELEVEPQYSGARIEGDVITLDFVKKMMDDFKNQKCLHKRYAFQIVLQTREMLRALPSLVDIDIPDGKHFTVCGDVHGQFYDLLNIFELNGLPSEENPYLFNGDFVDRGSFSVEVILTLFAFKCMCPSEVFCFLPLAHVLNQKVFVVHGGLFSVDGVKLSDIKAIDRFCEPPEEGLMCELLWSDPQPLPGRGPSKRGVGLSFGADVTKRFLQDNSLDLVVRSHEVKDEGYEIEHDGKLITVFSAPNYCDQMGNKGAFIRFEAPTLKPNIVTFAAVAPSTMPPWAPYPFYLSQCLVMKALLDEKKEDRGSGKSPGGS
ncbi:serine/threonine-protein phosphatase 5 [Citrus sinensis]|nr:serine/threonine-protein phosphatase 5 [Citrus sinensis]